MNIMKIAIIELPLLILLGCNSVTLQDKSKTETTKNWKMSDFVKADSINPILKPSSDQGFSCPISKQEVKWEEKNVLNPSAIIKDGRVYLIYRAQDREMTSRLGLAISEDGLHFKKLPAPVFHPDNDNMKLFEWAGGVEDPRIIEAEDGTYIMTYTAYDGKVARLCIASSKDLRNWTKHGLAFGEGKYRDIWSKSGAIVSKLDSGKIVATKIKAKYWMYFGDTDLFMATSDDLIHWTVAENEESQKMISVLHPRMGYFDSRLVEPGPYALLQEKGILLIYNGSNASNYNDPDLPKFTYAAGQALFDKENPFKLIDRMKGNFIHPDKPYEKTGEVNEVCFVEGLVYFRNQWLLYYGTADSKIAVAVKKE
ncbi:MAG: glycosidase [Bacteroidetes bacterium]|nr:MAG: glycosidase [Bacteroidota bacterium]